MANFFSIFTTAAAISLFGVLGFGSSVSVPDQMYKTAVGQMDYREIIRNPCRASSRLERLIGLPIEQQKMGDISTVEFDKQMLEEINSAIHILKGITKNKASDTHGECLGLGPLKTLPPVKDLEPLPEKQRVAEIYNMVIFLASHLEVMSMDRNMVGSNTGGMISLSPVYLRCGSESASLGQYFEDLRQKFEFMLCHIVAYEDGRDQVSFLKSENVLMKTEIMRFRSTCSAMEVRDCLVIHEIDNFLKHMEFLFKGLRYRESVAIRGINFPYRI